MKKRTHISQDQKLNKDMVIQLQNNSNYPNNKAHDFVFVLNTAISIDINNYEVGLLDIIYTKFNSLKSKYMDVKKLKIII